MTPHMFHRAPPLSGNTSVLIGWYDGGCVRVRFDSDLDPVASTQSIGDYALQELMEQSHSGMASMPTEISRQIIDPHAELLDKLERKVFSIVSPLSALLPQEE